ncbi:MAG: polyribonucleotide nucleotidyltransferase, partial [Proteobacteria bacterium]|nr:polyribonucleotide nucleotidyltransferase [Pseudomonadota bacterium]
MKITKTFQYGQNEFRLETGEIARQAAGSVIASLGETQVMVNVVCSRKAKPRDFMPLTVDVEERTYAAGRIPGGFFRREGRPSEKAILTCRLIDRPIRPLFPKGFFNDVQVVCTILSVDPEIDTEIVAMIGTSAALAISGIPFNGPIGAARVGYIDGVYVLSPTATQLAEQSQLDLVVAGTEGAVLMVESEAKELAEDVMLGAVMFGHEQLQVAIDIVTELAKEVGAEPMAWEAPAVNTELATTVAGIAEAGMSKAYQTADKKKRQELVAAVKDSVTEKLINEDTAEAAAGEIKGAVKTLEKQVV